MSEFRATLYDRDFSLQAQPPVKMRVDRFSKHALGGPSKAMLQVTGASAAVWDVVETLRKPVEIFDHYSRRCWWGIVSSATINQENLSFRVSLEKMTNRVAVAYSETTPGEISSGRRSTTTWVQDDDSVSTYGIIEALLSLGDQSLESANSLRDRQLARYKYPIPEITPGQISGQGAVTARLECEGWWKTLGWQYFTSLAGLESNDEPGDGGQALGTNSSQQVGQRFQLASTAAWYANTVQVKIRTQDAPVDNGIMELQTTSAFIPSGVVLGSAAVAASSISDNNEWVTFALATPVLLSPGVDYYIVLRRSGANDNGKYYEVDVEEGLSYPRGVFKIYNGAAWGARTPDADLVFRIAGTMETSEQIYSMLDAAQFVSGIDIQAASGLFHSQYRDGDCTILTELNALFKVGLTSGSRYLATITPERWVKVFAEPASSSNDRLLLDRSGAFYNRYGGKIPGHLVEPGQWVKLKDFIPNTLDTSRMADPSLFFLEEVEYDATSGKVIAIPQRAMEAMETISFAGGL